MLIVYNQNRSDVGYFNLLSTSYELLNLFSLEFSEEMFEKVSDWLAVNRSKGEILECSDCVYVLLLDNYYLEVDI